jgi:hypothetical protein
MEKEAYTNLINSNIEKIGLPKMVHPQKSSYSLQELEELGTIYMEDMEYKRKCFEARP